MHSFSYERATSVSHAMESAKGGGSRFLAGGTTIVDLMKCNVEQPEKLIDVTFMPGLGDIKVFPSKILIGSLTHMSTAADHPEIKAIAPAISESLWRAASPQIRNMATLGGNLLQRTRCPYFRDGLSNLPCNKRSPGSGCAAINGVNRNHAVLGTSASCIATYPGDFAVSLVAFDGKIHIHGDEARIVKAVDFFKVPGDTPHLDNALHSGEFITAIEIPVSKSLRYSHYLKVRDRSSYEFAAASAAAGIELESDGVTIKDLRIALGGVATKPWRLVALEQQLVGKPFTEEVIRRAALTAADGAEAYAHNEYKINLIPKVVARALMVSGSLV